MKLTERFNPTIFDLIEEAKDRKIKPYDLFYPGDKLISGKEIFELATERKDSSYRDNAIRRFKLSKEGDELYDTLLHYLDSYGTHNPTYKKLMSVIIKEGEVFDGKHRALLGAYLGIDIPVQFIGKSIKESLEEEDSAELYDAILDTFNISPFAEDGQCYILPDGDFLNLLDNAHIGVDDELFERGLIKEDPYQSGNLILIDKYNAIRISDGSNIQTDPYIELPAEKPTIDQLSSLERWIDNLSSDKVFVGVRDDKNAGQTYNLNSTKASHIIAKISRYYNTGRLVENVHNGIITPSIKVSTPYMLRNDGKLLECGDYHPYIKYERQATSKKGIEVLINEKPYFLEWTYKNTLQDTTIEDIKFLVKSVQKIEDYFHVNKERVDLLVKEFDAEDSDFSTVPYDIENCFEAINDAVNQEFCRVRVSSLKGGGISREIYFRISSTGFNWFDAIWKVVYENRNFIENVTVVTDTQSRGGSLKTISSDGVELSHISPMEFINLKGRPVIESAQIKNLYEAYGDFHPAYIHKLFEDRCQEDLEGNLTL